MTVMYFYSTYIVHALTLCFSAASSDQNKLLSNEDDKDVIAEARNVIEDIKQLDTGIYHPLCYSRLTILTCHHYIEGFTEKLKKKVANVQKGSLYKNV